MDVLVCNGLGIYCGMKTLAWLSMKPYQWQGLWNIPTYKYNFTKAAVFSVPTHLFFISYFRGVRLSYINSQWSETHLGFLEVLKDFFGLCQIRLRLHSCAVFRGTEKMADHKNSWPKNKLSRDQHDWKLMFKK